MSEQGRACAVKGCDESQAHRSKCREHYNAYMRIDSKKRRDALGLEGRKEKQLLRDYKMDLSQYGEKLAAQGGGCAICGSKKPGQSENYFEVDHDHTCCSGIRSCGRCVRGLLCSGCNQGISRFQDDAERLRKAADYLEGHAAP